MRYQLEPKAIAWGIAVDILGTLCAIQAVAIVLAAQIAASGSPAEEAAVSAAISRGLELWGLAFGMYFSFVGGHLAALLAPTSAVRNAAAVGVVSAAIGLAAEFAPAQAMPASVIGVPIWLLAGASFLCTVAGGIVVQAHEAASPSAAAPRWARILAIVLGWPWNRLAARLTANRVDAQSGPRLGVERRIDFADIRLLLLHPSRYFADLDADKASLPLALTAFFLGGLTEELSNVSSMIESLGIAAGIIVLFGGAAFAGLVQVLVFGGLWMFVGSRIFRGKASFHATIIAVGYALLWPMGLFVVTLAIVVVVAMATDRPDLVGEFALVMGWPLGGWGIVNALIAVRQLNGFSRKQTAGVFAWMFALIGLLVGGLMALASLQADAPAEPVSVPSDGTSAKLHRNPRSLGGGTLRSGTG